MYLVGGGTAVYAGWRLSSIDVDLFSEEESVFRDIQRIKERLNVNIEFARPEHFVPALRDSESRHVFIETVGGVSYYNYDPYAQVLSKVVRGFERDLDDARQFEQSGMVDPEKLRFTQHNVEHHVAHTASAYFISDWERSTGITVDGSGDFVSCMISECVGDQINVKKRVFLPQSLGSLYMMICEFIGYDRYGDEGKVMGLAPLGKDTYHDVFEQMTGARVRSSPP